MHQLPTNSTRTEAQPHVGSSALPNIGFLRQPQVLRLIPISKSTLWRRVQARTFPQPVKLSERITAWRAEDVHKWIEEKTVPS